MGQTFDNSGRGEQNIAQGDEAIGKQVNINQDMKGDSNIVAGSGNISIEHYHANLSRDRVPPLIIPSLLPSAPNLFIGRDNDMAALRQRLFGEPSTTLITSVRGWPGIGKTTLAAAMAHDAEVKKAFPDGVLWTALGMSPNLPWQGWGNGCLPSVMTRSGISALKSGRTGLPGCWTTAGCC